MKKIYLIIGILMAGILLSGCIQSTSTALTSEGDQPLVGGDRDEHGCIGSAGYTWCEPKQKCLREWEETCEEPMPGSDRDEHGCIGSAGYSWCEPKNKCIRPWEETCEEEKSIEELAEGFCTEENVAEINTCNGYIQVISSLMGGGSAYYTVADGALGEATQCPIVGPEYISEECKTFEGGEDCNTVECPPGIGTIEYFAEEFCDQPDVFSVYVCGEYAKVTESEDGMSMTFYKLEADDSWGEEIQCIDGAPEEVSEQCELLMNGSNCIETQIC